MVLVFICGAALLCVPRGVPLRGTFHNIFMGQLIRCPEDCILGYSVTNATRILLRGSNGPPCGISLWRQSLAQLEVISRKKEPLFDVAVHMALENGFHASAERYDVGRVRFMQQPGITIEGPTRTGWGRLTVAIDGGDAHILLMTAGSCFEARRLAPTWRRMTHSCRPAEFRQWQPEPWH
jgi:hypothetical protein